MASGQVDGNTGNFLLSLASQTAEHACRGGAPGREPSHGVPQTAFIAAAAAQEQQRPPSFADLADKVRPGRGERQCEIRRAAAENQRSRRADTGFAAGLPRLLRPVQEGPAGTPSHPRARLGLPDLDDGYVVTNHHVADKADEIEITFENEEKYKAKVIGSDARTDIALLKIESKNGRSSIVTSNSPIACRALANGYWPSAIRSALAARLRPASSRPQGRDIGSGPYDFLQIDAAVNRGNSGGPSVNLRRQGHRREHRDL